MDHTHMHTHTPTNMRTQIIDINVANNESDSRS